MTDYQERLNYFATAKRIDTQVISQYIDGDFINFYVGKLRGKIVGGKDTYKFKEKADAISNARNFRQSCIDELKEVQSD